MKYLHYCTCTSEYFKIWEDHSIRHDDVLNECEEEILFFSSGAFDIIGDEISIIYANNMAGDDGELLKNIYLSILKLYNKIYDIKNVDIKNDTRSDNSYLDSIKVACMKEQIESKR